MANRTRKIYPLSTHSDQWIPTDVLGPAAALWIPFAASTTSTVALPELPADPSKPDLDRRIYRIGEFSSDVTCNVSLGDPAVAPVGDTIMEDNFFVHGNREHCVILEITGVSISVFSSSGAGNLVVNLLIDYQGFATRETFGHR